MIGKTLLKLFENYSRMPSSSVMQGQAVDGIHQKSNLGHIGVCYQSLLIRRVTLPCRDSGLKHTDRLRFSILLEGPKSRLSSLVAAICDGVHHLAACS